MLPAVVAGATVSDTAGSGLSEQPVMDIPMIRKILNTRMIFGWFSMHNDYPVLY
jgi:hypothetical protein